MRTARLMVLGLVAMFALAVTARAADEEKTLKGTITCAKCDLKVEGQDKCATVIKVKDGDKDVVYYFDTKADKKNHGKICKEPMKGKVTGKVSKDGDKHIITVTKVEFDDK